MPAPYLRLADIAALYKISVRTAQRWKKLDGWRHRGDGPNRRYSVTDAHASYNQHKQGRTARHLTRRYGRQDDEQQGQ